MIGVKDVKKCDNCNVNVFESESSCPLCHKKLGLPESTIVEYPKYYNILKEKSPLRNLPLFISLLIILVCVFINLFTYSDGETIWSIIVSVSSVYSFVMYYVITKNMRLGRKIIYSYIATSVLSITIDFTSGMHFWATDYVFPFLTVATVLYLCALALRNKRMFSEYFGFIMTVTLVSFSSIIINFLGLNNTRWGPFVSILTSVIVALGLYLIADKKLKDEMKKRFHR